MQKGAAFEDLVKRFSNDINSVNSGGVLAEFGTGDLDPNFEKIAYSLKNIGDYSKPFSSDYGFHIIKLVETKPVSTDINDAVYSAYIKDKVIRDDRLIKAKQTLNIKHLSLIKYKPAIVNTVELWKFTDSAIAGKSVAAIKAINNKTVLFTFAKQAIAAGDWVKFVKAIKAIPSPLSNTTYPELLKEYVKVTGEEYYRNHLEDYSASYNQQVSEFKEANLLFGIMDKYVWSKANVDSSGLLQYFNKNKAKYQWEKSADALIVTSGTKELATELQQTLKQSPNTWRAALDSFEGKVTIDSNRYELGQLPVIDRTNFTEGIVTAPVKNEADGSYTFNVVLKMYNDVDQRSFEDAKGMVISDYQQVLEDQWIRELKKKYPVKINQPVFASLK